MVYGKSCHLPVEVEYKAIWATKLLNLEIKGGQEKEQSTCMDWKRLDWKHMRVQKSTKKEQKPFMKKISPKDFNIGDQVMLFNSRLKLFPRKLKSRWSGPYTIKEVLPYGAITITGKGSYKFIVNG